MFFYFRLNGPSIPAIVKPSEALNPKTSASPRAIELIKRKVPIPREHDQLSMQRSVGGDSDGVLTRERSHSRSSNMSGSSNRTFNGQYETQTHFKSMSISSSTEVSTTTPLSTKYVTYQGRLFLVPLSQIKEQKCHSF